MQPHSLPCFPLHCGLHTAGLTEHHLQDITGIDQARKAIVLGKKLGYVCHIV